MATVEVSYVSRHELAMDCPLCGRPVIIESVRESVVRRNAPPLAWTVYTCPHAQHQVHLILSGKLVGVRAGQSPSPDNPAV